jgi:hypothetical protein
VFFRDDVVGGGGVTGAWISVGGAVFWSPVFSPRGAIGAATGEGAMPAETSSGEALNDSGLASEFSTRVAVGVDAGSGFAGEIFSDLTATLGAGNGAVMAVSPAAAGASIGRAVGVGDAEEFAGLVKTIGWAKVKLSLDESGSTLCGGTRSWSLIFSDEPANAPAFSTAAGDEEALASSVGRNERMMRFGLPTPVFDAFTEPGWAGRELEASEAEPRRSGVGSVPATGEVDRVGAGSWEIWIGSPAAETDQPTIWPSMAWRTVMKGFPAWRSSRERSR